MSDSRELKQKRKLIEFIAALSGFLGIIVALISPSHQLAALYVLFLVILIIASTLAYAKLLSVRKWERFERIGYSLDVSLISLSFSILLTLALASSISEVLASSSLSGTVAYAVYVVIVILFYAMFFFLIQSELKLKRSKDKNSDDVWT